MIISLPHFPQKFSPKWTLLLSALLLVSKAHAQEPCDDDEDEEEDGCIQYPVDSVEPDACQVTTTIGTCLKNYSTTSGGSCGPYKRRPLST